MAVSICAWFSYINLMKKKISGENVALAATALAVQLAECYSDKELNRIKIFLYQVINSLNTIQGHIATFDDIDSL